MAVSNVVFAIAMMLVLLRITQYVSLISTRLFVMRRSASNALRMLKCAGASPGPNPSPDPDALAPVLITTPASTFCPHPFPNAGTSPC